MEKEFKRSYMHPTRRKLADMVHTGEYDKDISVGYGGEGEVTRKVGEKWEDEKYVYEQKEGYVTKATKNTDIYTDIRKYLREKETCKGVDCKTKHKSPKDKKLIIKTGYCINCLAEIETSIRHAGIWQEYQNYRIWTKMIVEGKTKLEQLRQAKDEAKQTYEYVNSDGNTDTWELDEPVEEVKKNLQTIIDNGEKEVAEIEEKRKEAYKIIEEAGYAEYV